VLEESPWRGLHGGPFPLETFFHVSSPASNPVNPGAFEGLIFPFRLYPQGRQSIGQTHFRLKAHLLTMSNYITMF